MLLSIFSFLLVIFVITFCNYKKILHLYEILFIWMTVWLITHSVSSILIINLELISLSNDKSDFWTHFFKRLLLYPLIIIIFFDLYLRIKNKIGKVTILIINICFMSSLEFLFIFLGVLKNKNFNLNHSLMEWSFTILLTYILWLWYRKKRLKRD
ncbi:hypothetical protein AM500_03170 [Bacillus sp. FJAT-18017]|nr:hypothetical protein AM500_03170 [Bacillus sp. FJAT-18017]